MSWELLLVALAGLATLVGVAAWALTGRGEAKQRAKDLEDHANAAAEAAKRGEEFDAGGGLSGGIRRAHKLRDAASKRNL